MGEADVIEVDFEPGLIGVNHDPADGRIQKVAPDGTARRLGVTEGMRMTKINGQPFTDTLFKATLTEHRTITFEAPELGFGAYDDELQDALFLGETHCRGCPIGEMLAVASQPVKNTFIH